MLTLNQTAQKPNTIFLQPHFPRQPVILMLRTEAVCRQISGLEGPKQKLAAEFHGSVVSPERAAEASSKISWNLPNFVVLLHSNCAKITGSGDDGRGGELLPCSLCCHANKRACCYAPLSLATTYSVTPG